MRLRTVGSLLAGSCVPGPENRKWGNEATEKPDHGGS